MIRNRETIKKSKINKFLKREYVPLYISALILIVLIIALIFVLLDKDDKGLILPDPPTEKHLSVEVYDYKENDDTNDLTKEVAGYLKTEYHFVTDYYKKGIMLSGTQVDYLDGNFIIRSGMYSDIPFMSVVDKSGKLKWLTKINTSSYDSLKIKSVLKIDDNYYVIAEGTSNNLRDHLVIKIDNKGKEVKRETISKGVLNNVNDALVIDEYLAIITDGSEGVVVYTLSKDLKEVSKPYYLKNDDNNIFNLYYPYVKSVIYKDKVLTMVVNYNGTKDDKIYLVNYNIDSKSSTITPFKELMEVENPYSNQIYNINNSFLIGKNKKVIMYNENGNMIKSHDYSNLKFKKESYTVEVQEGVQETYQNEMHVDGITIYGDNILLKGTNASQYIYDLYDKDLNLQKRFVLDQDEYEAEEHILLKVFYIDGKLYEIHSYGFNTPSIMISVIG